MSRMRGRLARPVLRGPRLGNEPGLPDGSVGSDGQPTKLMCVYDHAHRLVLTQTAVVAGDEIAAFTVALATLPFPANVLVTADALHCVRHEVAREREVTREERRLMLSSA